MERLILFALVYLLPTQLAYHFWPDFSYIYGIRVDYLSPTFYLTDLIFLFLLPYLIKGFFKDRFKIINKRNCFLFLITIVFIVLNIFYALSPITALFKWLTVFKLVTIGYYFYSCKLPDIKKILSSALICSLATFSLIGIIQFFTQKTLGGIFYFLGERSFSFITPGISLMNIFGNKLMRAYSVFPHPNSFAGFFLAATLIVFALSLDKKGNIKLDRKVLRILLLTDLVVLFITLSLNALLTTIVVFMVYYLIISKPNIVLKTKIYLPILLFTASLLFAVNSNFLFKHVRLNETYADRLSLASKSMQLFSTKTTLGGGLNNFFTFSKNTQPPHNIYLIIFSETGLVGVVIVYFLITKLVNKNLNIYIFLSLVFVLISGLFDHYWLTLRQNQILLTMLLGLSLRRGREEV